MARRNAFFIFPVEGKPGLTASVKADLILLRRNVPYQSAASVQVSRSLRCEAPTTSVIGLPELAIHADSMRNLCVYFFMSVFPFAISGSALFVLTRVAMTYPEKLDAIIRVVQFPRTAIRALGKAVVLVHTSAKLLFLRMSNVCLAKVPDVSQAELMQRIKANHAHLILDVRSLEEYKKGHIPSAINIPHDRLGSRLAELGSHINKDVVLYCWSGGRVAIAANILRSAGFSKLLHLDGDMNGWLSNGRLPVAQ